VGFVANDMRGSVTIFMILLFRIFHAVNPINKACCNVIKGDFNIYMMNG
jgi:hypothetical protein